MNIGAVSENKQFEKRISITPEIVKKYNKLGFKVIIEKDYGSHLGFSDKEYIDCGAQIVPDKKSVIDKSDVILQLNLPPEENLSLIKEGKILIGLFNYHQNREKLIQLTQERNKYYRKANVIVNNLKNAEEALIAIKAKPQKYYE